MGRITLYSSDKTHMNTVLIASDMRTVNIYKHVCFVAQQATHIMLRMYRLKLPGQRGNTIIATFYKQLVIATVAFQGIQHGTYWAHAAKNSTVIGRLNL